MTHRPTTKPLRRRAALRRAQRYSELGPAGTADRPADPPAPEGALARGPGVSVDPPTARARLGRLSLGLALFAGLALVYSAFATGGTGRFGPGEFPYHDMLGEAFLAGQLHLKPTPDPEVLALANPYDPNQSNPLNKLHDASLYQGRYYLYWGPVPAVLHALWRLVTQSALYGSIVSVAAALMMSGSFWLILRRLRRRHFPSGAPWVVSGSSVAFACGGIMPYLVGRPSVYHESLLVGAAFALAAWYALLVACEPGGPRRRALVWGGLLLGCAIGSRMTHLAYAVGPGLILGWALLRAGPATRRAALLDLVAFGAPIAGIGLALLLYNAQRFGSPFEFGMSYTLQGPKAFYEMMRRPDNTLGAFFDPRLLRQNPALYLFGIPAAFLPYPWFPLAWWTTFTGTGFLFPDVSRYRGAFIEPPIISLFLLAPTTVLTLGLPALLVSRRCVLRGAIRGWLTGLGLGVLLMLLLLGSARYVTIRFMVDILPAVTLLGTVVLLAGSARRGVGQGALGRSLLPTFAMVAWGNSMLLGLLLGLSVWIWSFPPQATRVQGIANEWVAWLGATLRPAAVPIGTAPTDRTTWRHVDGHYLKGGTIYLRAPARGAILVLTFSSELPAGSEVAIEVKGESRLRGPMLARGQLWWTPALADVEAGEVVPIRLELPSQAALPPGSPLPLVVSELRFVSGPTELELYRQSRR